MEINLKPKRRRHRANQIIHHWRVAIVAGAAAFAVVALAIGAIVAQVKTVTIIDAGVAHNVNTIAGSVEEVLNSQGIAVSQRDLVTPRLDAAVPDNGTIKITRAHQATLRETSGLRDIWVHGVTLAQQVSKLPQTTGQIGSAAAAVAPLLLVNREDYLPVAPEASVVKLIHDGRVDELQAEAYADLGSLIRANGITLNPLDTLGVRRDSDGSLIAQIERVIRRNVTREVTIPFAKKTVKDAKVPRGQKAVTTAGRAGKRTIVEFQELVDGQVQRKYVVSERVSVKPVTEITTVGTGEPSKATKQLNGSAVINVPKGPANPTGAQAIARDMLGSFGFGADQFGCLVQLWTRESGWNVYSANASSGAYGIPQALPGSKMASAGADWRTNPATQIRWGLGYIRGRYGTPCGAWGHFLSHNWY